MNTLRLDMFRLAAGYLADEDGHVEVLDCLMIPALYDGPDDPAKEPADERAAREDVARELCRECPIRARCLDYAVRVRPGRGMWGGFSLDDIDAVFPLSLGEVA